MNRLLQNLTELTGLSGGEDAVRTAIERELDGNVEYTVDRIGNLYAHSRGFFHNDIKLMVSAHMDEVGLMVTHITEEGYLKFQPVGGIDERILPGKAVLVGKKKLTGVIGSLAIHLQDKEARDKVTKMRDLFIDIGAADKADAERNVRVGDTVSFAHPSRELGHLIRAKALDDRVGCTLLCELLKEEQDANFTAVFTTREEVGCFGGAAAASAVKPKYAIILEGTTASDIGTTPETDNVCVVGKGPVLSFMDNATIYDKKLLELAQNVCKRKGIPYQLKRAVAGGNEAGKIQRAAGGCHVLAVSLPCRYIHGPVSVASESDMKAMKQLVSALLAELK